MLNRILFTRAEFITAAHGDDVLRAVLPDGQMFTGSDTFGYTVTIMHLGRLELATTAAAVGNPWATENRNMPRGWYLIKQNSDGLVWGHYYGDEEDSEANAFKDFAEVEQAYDTWATDDQLLEY